MSNNQCARDSFGVKNTTKLMNKSRIIIISLSEVDTANSESNYSDIMSAKSRLDALHEFVYLIEVVLWGSKNCLNTKYVKSYFF
jgi:hypothetical protein